MDRHGTIWQLTFSTHANALIRAKSGRLVDGIEHKRASPQLNNPDDSIGLQQTLFRSSESIGSQAYSNIRLVGRIRE